MELLSYFLTDRDELAARRERAVPRLSWGGRLRWP